MFQGPKKKRAQPKEIGMNKNFHLSEKKKKVLVHYSQNLSQFHEHNPLTCEGE